MAPLSILLLLVPMLTAAQPGFGQQGTITGTLSVLWGDGAPGSGVDDLRYRLTDDRGLSYELEVDPELVAAAGGITELDRRRVTVSGVVESPMVAVPGPIEPVIDVRALRPDVVGSADALADVSGAVPWVSIMCRFADVAAEPRSPSYVQGLIGGASPGLDFYWREVSYNNIDLTGSVVVGWFTLPQPRSYYVYSYGGSQVFDFNRATTDCTGVADPAVYFPAFAGIQMLFNADLDGYAWGGGTWLNRDGVSRVYHATWYPPWGYSNQAPIAHEMGHGLGLPHSSGPYAATYDSTWDVMSNAWACGVNLDPTYGCVGQHTISYHKDILGWIPASQKVVVAPGAEANVALDSLALPPGSNDLMVQIPIGSSSRFYTVEKRELNGFDAAVPGAAVVIHEVDPSRSRPAQVVDPDGDGDPNDDGAMWTMGETFVDSANGITITLSTYRIFISDDEEAAADSVAAAEFAPGEISGIIGRLWSELWAPVGLPSLAGVSSPGSPPTSLTLGPGAGFPGGTAAGAAPVPQGGSLGISVTVINGS